MNKNILVLSSETIHQNDLFSAVVAFMLNKGLI